MEEITATTTDTGADTQTQYADTAGNQDVAVAGADTPVQSAEIEGGEGTEGQEGNQATEGMQPHQVPLEQRVQQLVEKRLAEMEAKLQQQQVQQPPPFAPEQQVMELQSLISNAIMRESELVQNIQYEENPHTKNELIGELRKLRKWLPSAEEALEKDIHARQTWQQKQQADQQNQQRVEHLNAQMMQTADFYRKEMNIPEPVWNAARDFFASERKNNPLLDQRFQQIWMRSGEIAALDFAREHCDKHMGKKQQQVIQQKEELKNLTPQGKTSTGALNTVDLDALRSKAQRSGLAEDLAAYSTAKSKIYAAR